MAADIRICTAHVTLKEFVTKSTRALYAWVSGSAIVLVTDPLMLTTAGTQFPGSRGRSTSPTGLITADSGFVLSWKVIIKIVGRNSILDIKDIHNNKHFWYYKQAQ